MKTRIPRDVATARRSGRPIPGALGTAGWAQAEADRARIRSVLRAPPDWRGPETRSVPASTTKHGAAGVFIQPKLIVGAVNDPLEHEADRAADEVMRELSVGAAPYLQRTIGNQAVQRLLQAELDGREAAYPTQDATGSAHDLSQAPAHSKAPGTLQAKLKVDEPADVYEREADRIADPALASVDQALAGPGQPLEPALRQDMEQGFGHDFSQVRVHTDAAAAGSAQEVNAHAYTVGRRVVFNAGKYSPGTSEGRRLIAHELTHVVQGDAATASPGGQASTVSSLEGEAQFAAHTVQQGGLVPPIRGVAPSQAVPLRQPTFGDLTGRTPVAGHRVELRQIGGQWFEINLESNARTLATGGYNFVVQAGRTYGSRYGHLEAAAGGRVTFAGRIGFSQGGQLNYWNAGSGSYRPAESFAQQAGLPMNKFRVLPPPPEDLLGGRPDPKSVQLPVFQPGAGNQGSGGPPKDTPTKPDEPDPSKAPKTAKPAAKTPAAKTPKTSATDTGGSKTLPKTPPKTPSVGTGGITPATKVGTGATTSGATSPGQRTQAAYRKAVAKAIASTGHNVRMAQEFTQRVQKYIAVWGALQHALGLLSTIESMEELFAHGTVLKEQQDEADKALKSGTEAIDQAEVTVEDISLFAWTVLIGEATRNEDEQSLFAFDEALGKISDPLEESAKRLTEISNDLTQNANPLKQTMYEQLVEIVRPHQEGTYPNAEAFALFTSLERLHGTMTAAASNYAIASQNLTSWAEQLRGLENTAEDAAWFFARKHARARLLAEQARKRN